MRSQLPLVRYLKRIDPKSLLVGATGSFSLAKFTWLACTDVSERISANILCRAHLFLLESRHAMMGAHGDVDVRGTHGFSRDGIKWFAFMPFENNFMGNNVMLIIAGSFERTQCGDPKVS